MILIKKLKEIFCGPQKSYQSNLEAYIVARNPQDIADVERLTKQYDLAVAKGFFQ